MFDRKKIKKFILNFFLFVFILSIVGFKYHKSADDNYGLIYPSWWNKTEVKSGFYFNGLIISPYKIIDNQQSYSENVFVEITISKTENQLTDVKTYIQKLKNSEILRLKKPGEYPIIPGPAQYQYFGKLKTFSNGFEEITSLFTLSDVEAHEYWKINNGKLLQVKVKYPKSQKRKIEFDMVVKIIIWTFKTF